MSAMGLDQSVERRLGLRLPWGEVAQAPARWDVGDVLLGASPAAVVATLPDGWRTLQAIQLYATGSWQYAGDSGVLVPGPDGAWFRIHVVDAHKTLVAAGSGVLLTYVLEGL